MARNSATNGDWGPMMVLVSIRPRRPYWPSEASHPLPENLPRTDPCTYDAARDCPGGDCVVGAIAAQRVSDRKFHKGFVVLVFVVYATWTVSMFRSI
jgi:hypothetical protein